ncbi:MAG: hypothetical protein GX631_10320 [Dehalococcoidales bacterium]|jgi:hypothetical protein|nr:hypothetical protein [Dehalococcoidales bacterium]
MPGTKYDKFILRDVKAPWPSMGPMNSDFLGGKADFMKNIEGARPNFALYYVTRKGMFSEPPHSHYADEYLMFLPADPHDMKNLGAVVEVAYGEEWEKVEFSTSAMVLFPKGIQHCPIHVKSMDRPFLFGHFWPMGEEPVMIPAR